MSKEIIVQLAKPERYYSRCYHDFMDCKLLNGEEKIIFLALKRFLDVKLDNGNVYPTIESIQEITNWGNQKVVKYIKSLVKKGIVKKVRQGLSKPNIYTLTDYPIMWTCDNLKDMAIIIDNQGVKPLTPAEHIAELEKMGYKIEIKEKEPGTTAPTKVTVEPSTQQSNIFNQSNNTTFFSKSQSLERYTLDQIKEIFEYDALIHDYSYFSQEINAVMELLHDILNTTKGTIRINKEDKPAMTVIGKLMKLGKESIAYSIKKFQEQTDRIKNPRSYMLAILYNAPEQYIFDVTNQVQYDMHN